MLFWGIDPSISNTGLVGLDEHGRVVLAVDGSDFVTRKRRYSSDTERYLAQADGLALSMLDHGASDKDAAVYENYSFGSEHRAYSLAEYGGILKATLLTRIGLVPTLAAPTAVKRFATGNGSATKDMIRRVAAVEWPASENRSEDIRDAYYMALLSFYKTCPELAAKAQKGNRLLRTRLASAKELGNDGKTCGHGVPGGTARAKRLSLRNARQRQ